MVLEKKARDSTPVSRPSQVGNYLTAITTWLITSLSIFTVSIFAVFYLVYPVFSDVMPNARIDEHGFMRALGMIFLISLFVGIPLTATWYAVASNVARIKVARMAELVKKDYVTSHTVDENTVSNDSHHHFTEENIRQLIDHELGKRQHKARVVNSENVVDETRVSDAPVVAENVDSVNNESIVEKENNSEHDEIYSNEDVIARTDSVPVVNTEPQSNMSVEDYPSHR